MSSHKQYQLTSQAQGEVGHIDFALKL